MYLLMIEEVIAVRHHMETKQEKVRLFLLKRNMMFQVDNFAHARKGDCCEVPSESQALP